VAIKKVLAIIPLLSALSPATFAYLPEVLVSSRTDYYNSLISPEPQNLLVFTRMHDLGCGYDSTRLENLISQQLGTYEISPTFIREENSTHERIALFVNFTCSPPATHNQNRYDVALTVTFGYAKFNPGMVWNTNYAPNGSMMRRSIDDIEYQINEAIHTAIYHYSYPNGLPEPSRQ